MANRIELSGRYIRLEEAKLREKAARADDPRARFYRAMLEANTYEDYYRLAGTDSVQPKSYVSRRVNAHMEIKYARNPRKWIADANR